MGGVARHRRTERCERGSFGRSAGSQVMNSEPQQDASGDFQMPEVT